MIRYMQMFVVVLTCIVVMAILSGCSPAVYQRAAEFNDLLIEKAERGICKDASVGSVQRAYGHRPQAWSELCRPAAGFVPGLGK